MTGTPQRTRSLVPIRRPARPRLRLVAFPFAGGGMLAVRAWQRAAPAGCEYLAAVLPGREHRSQEPPLTNIEEAARQIAGDIAALPALPFALLGHSMGALLGFLVARELFRTGAPAPAHVFVSGFRAPHLPDSRPPTASMSDPQFVAMLQQLGGTAPDLLASCEFMSVLLPVLRADFELVENYRHRDAPALICPVTAFTGAADLEASPVSMRQWSKHTSRGFRLEVHPGDHFFLQRAEQAHATVRTVLAGLLGRETSISSDRWRDETAARISLAHAKETYDG